MASVQLVSVNIEGSKHLDLVDAFLSEQMPEVVCVQELFEKDVDRIARALGGAHATFVPMMRFEDPRGGTSLSGVGIFSRLPVTAAGASYYAGDPDTIVDFDETSVETRNRTRNRLLLRCDIEKDGTLFGIATTHFTWTPKGYPDDFQRQDMKALLAILATWDEFILCGDFNAPRILDGSTGEIFAMLADTYKDNIPATYATSLDPARHKAPIPEQADKMVDGIFSTPAYTVTDVVLHTGVSDHCAITVMISRT